MLSLFQPRGRVRDRVFGAAVAVPSVPPSRRADVGGAGEGVKGRACVSCGLGGGKDRVLDGHAVIMCDECWPSEFRRGRVLERLGVVAKCDCGREHR